jgi:Ca2+/Na+ antiporter
MKELTMSRKIKNLLGTVILDFLALLGISGFWVMGLALAPVKRQKGRRI